MKKVIILFTLVMMALVGCNAGNNQFDDNDNYEINRADDQRGQIGEHEQIGGGNDMEEEINGPSGMENEDINRGRD